MVASAEQEPRDDAEPIRRELQIAREENEAAARKIEERETTIASLEQALAGRESESYALRQSLNDAGRELTEVQETLAQAMASYRSLALASNPELPEELITGSTVEEVDTSLANARKLVERVKLEIEAEASRTRVPAGAPQRTPVDLSSLSSREKIQYAIGGKH